MRYTGESLERFAHAVLSAFGCNNDEADTVAEHLVMANLTGHDSHGVGMLPLYGEQVLGGNLVPNQTPELHAPVGAISVVDARRGFGHRIALLALDHAMLTLPEHKVAVLGLRNSGHVSRVGAYSEYCASKGYVSLHMVSVEGHQPLVAPHGAREGGFSTNPVSIAMPVAGKAKPLLDMATSTVAFGKVRVASNKGESVPLGYLVDADGVPTTNPDPMVDRFEGALSAFGAHKGSGLGLFVELLASALVGPDTVATMEHLPKGVLNNMFSVILDPAGFDDISNVERRTNEFYDFIKARPVAKGSESVLMPGEPEQISQRERMENGIPLDDETVRQIVEIGTRFSLEPERLQSMLKMA